MVDRDRMLAELTAAMRRRHRRRRGRRRVAAALAMVAITTGAVLIATPFTEPLPQTDSVVTVIRSTPRTGLIRTIGDDELLDRLAEIEKPTGMIRTDGRTWLTEPPI